MLFDCTERVVLIERCDELIGKGVVLIAALDAVEESKAGTRVNPGTQGVEDKAGFSLPGASSIRISIFQAAGIGYAVGVGEDGILMFADEVAVG